MLCRERANRGQSLRKCYMGTVAVIWRKLNRNFIEKSLYIS